MVNQIWITKNDQGYCMTYNAGEGSSLLTHLPGKYNHAIFVPFHKAISKLATLPSSSYEGGVSISINKEAPVPIEPHEESTFVAVIRGLEKIALESRKNRLKLEDIQSILNESK